MDDIELATLRDEFAKDCEVAQAAAQLAAERFGSAEVMGPGNMKRAG